MGEINNYSMNKEELINNESPKAPFRGFGSIYWRAAWAQVSDRWLMICPNAWPLLQEGLFYFT